jgi:hypothetical protein
VVAFDESGEAADGEEITNKSQRLKWIEGGWKQDRIRLPEKRLDIALEMCPIDADFKHFHA